MKSFWPEFLYYTRTERRGIIVLAILVILLFILPKFYPLWVSDATTDFTQFVEEIEVAHAQVPEEEPEGFPLFFFDPNTATKDDFIKLGLSPKVSQTIINYRKKGGSFRQKQDLGKIYSLSDEDYERLLPFVQLSENESEDVKGNENMHHKETAASRLFPFDPNTAIETELRQLGLSDRVIRTMLNYREKGGRFRHKEDLKKIYGLREADYNRLEPFIQIEAEVIANDSHPIASLEKDHLVNSYRKPKDVKIDINQATAEEWQQLYGIGPAYSKRIVKFRDKLGGFYSVDQIAETYGLPDSTFQQIKPHLVLSPIIKSLAINRVSEEELKVHPYLRWKEAKVIVSYREQHGPFHSAEDLSKVKILSGELIEKLRPYLTFE